MSGFIVIGVSGSEHAHPALHWGVEFAVARHLRIELAHVVDTTWGVEAAPELVASAITTAERKIKEEADRVSSIHPTSAVHGVVLVGSPERELVDYAREADLLVVGSHALERFGDQIFSRRAARVAERAECSVAVIPSDHSTGSGVVVGVDGSEVSMKALRFGGDEADRHNEPLTAVHAWTPPWPWDSDPAVVWPEGPSPEDELVLSESVAGLAADYPDLAVTRSLPTARPADALYAASIGARLLAVGSHGRNAVERIWFGSVSAEVLLMMPCPVVVVR